MRISWVVSNLTDYTAILDIYTIEDILDHNDLTTEDCLIFLVENEFVTLPKIKPLEFDD